jgi:hypothetical protein
VAITLAMCGAGVALGEAEEDSAVRGGVAGAIVVADDDRSDWGVGAGDEADEAVGTGDPQPPIKTTNAKAAAGAREPRIVASPFGGCIRL